MRKGFVFSLFFLLSACYQAKKADTCELVSMNIKIDSILNSFVQQNNCERCVYEIYIDKKDPHFYEIILYKGKKSLTAEENHWSKQKSLQKIKIKDVFFYIYNGTERYFSNREGQDSSGFDKAVLSVDSLHLSKNYYNEGDIWVIRDEYGEIEVEKVEHRYPFIPGPKKEIRLPEK